MEFSSVISSRFATRSYRPDEIPQDVLQRLFKALQSAPSARNMQPYKFIFVVDKDLRRQIAQQACHQEFILDAPLIVVAHCEKDKALDVGIAMDHMLLAAADQGLGSCWIGWFEQSPVRQILQIPQDRDIPVMATLGYTNEQPPQKERKPIEELVEVR